MKWDPRDLKEECRLEAYEYFDKNIRELPRKKSGEFDISPEDFYDNDVDAFRHAYTSGVFVQVYKFEIIADVLGQLQEIFGKNKPSSQNMDYWNNAVGRKYGKKVKTREKLYKLIQKALENGELIIHPSDPRKYKGSSDSKIDTQKSVVVLKELETGRNELFLDLNNGSIMDRETFVNLIKAEKYPGYTVASINDLATPISKPDGNPFNNLG
ncbi:DUF6973 domain-containing protein [Thermoproteota archaeon]